MHMEDEALKAVFNSLGFVSGSPAMVPEDRGLIGIERLGRVFVEFQDLGTWCVEPVHHDNEIRVHRAIVPRDERVDDFFDRLVRIDESHPAPRDYGLVAALDVVGHCAFDEVEGHAVNYAIGLIGAEVGHRRTSQRKFPSDMRPPAPTPTGLISLRHHPTQRARRK